MKYACDQRGKDYVWGGQGPNVFDCSGLTGEAYKAAGIWTKEPDASAQGQYNRGPQLPGVHPKPGGGDPMPGDLLFFRSKGSKEITHVGISLGGELMVNAPQSGDVVKVQSANRPDYVGATRPAGSAVPVDAVAPVPAAPITPPEVAVPPSSVVPPPPPSSVVPPPSAAPVPVPLPSRPPPGPTAPPSSATTADALAPAPLAPMPIWKR